MLILRVVVSLFLSMMVLCSSAASGQDFPNKPIRILAAEPGGTADFAARLLSQEISGAIHQPVIVDNRPAPLIAEIVAKSSPDGYTLLLIGTYPDWILQYMRDNVPVNVARDLSPVSMLASLPSVLVVHPSVPANSVKELIALAKSKPGELNYGSSSTGGSPHLGGELFKALAGVNIVAIPYKGSGAAINALIGGEVRLMFASAGSVVQHIKSGKVRALAVTSAQPSEQLPGLPAVAASVPGYELVTTLAVFAPAKTPAQVVHRLNQEIVRYLKTTEGKEKYLGLGADVIGSSPAELTAKIKSEMTRMGKVIKNAGIRAE